MSDDLHITVAVIVEKDGKFLMVEEMCRGKRVFNQPAGHVENGESLAAAAIRETFEETGWHIAVDSVVSIYRWRVPDSGETFFRIAFTGQLLEHDPDQLLDEGILRAVWMSPDELQQAADQLRSPLVMRGVNDFLKNIRYPIDLIVDM
ncbi:MAG: NUDIX hydrolase [Gammaproteobacteria bacterium]|nr:NUDIX hydrolase [Gammaproteobacteria bacterium]